MRAGEETCETLLEAVVALGEARSWAEGSCASTPFILWSAAAANAEFWTEKSERREDGWTTCSDSVFETSIAAISTGEGMAPMDICIDIGMAEEDSMSDGWNMEGREAARCAAWAVGRPREASDCGCEGSRTEGKGEDMSPGGKGWKEELSIVGDATFAAS